MGPAHAHGKGRHGPPNVVRLLWLGLVVAAVAKELRTPSEERTWHGKVAGFVPYDFRVPTPSRIKHRMWAPKDDHVLVPHPFGVGWTVNVGRVVALVRERLAA
jgi:hypothetical protein